MKGSAGRITALARNGFRQAIRDRVLSVLAGFGVVLILASVFISQLTVGERGRVIMDLGLTGISVLATLTAVFVTSNQVARELERRTLATVLAKPVARWELVVGRFAGMAATLALVVAGTGLVHLGVLAVAGVLDAPPWSALYLGWIESLLVTAIALFFSSFMTPLPAVFVSLAFVVIGHSSWGLKMLASQLEGGAFRVVLDALYVLLPNLELLNVRLQAAWGAPVAASTVAWGTAYGLGYTAVLLVLASALLSRRDLA